MEIGLLMKQFLRLVPKKFFFQSKNFLFCSFCVGNNSPVSPHIQQNGFGTSPQPNSNTQVTPPSQPVSSIGQQFTGATWTGSNTLTYTQSMQPPDNRSHHTAYCKWGYLLFFFLHSSPFQGITMQQIKWATI